jgi:hypothetical protein
VPCPLPSLPPPGTDIGIFHFGCFAVPAGRKTRLFVVFDPLWGKKKSRIDKRGGVSAASNPLYAKTAVPIQSNPLKPSPPLPSSLGKPSEPPPSPQKKTKTQNLPSKETPIYTHTKNAVEQRREEGGGPNLNPPPQKKKSRNPTPELHPKRIPPSLPVSLYKKQIYLPCVHACVHAYAQPFPSSFPPLPRPKRKSSPRLNSTRGKEERGGGEGVGN